MTLSFLPKELHKEGTVVYIVHDGTHLQEKQAQDYRKELQQNTRKATVVLSCKDRAGLALIDFYDITQYPSVLIVDNADRVKHMWGAQLPQIDHVAYLAGE